MALTDYIPNVFGNVPEVYQGLLGPEETANLKNRSNIQGLLGAVAALSQGMSSQGPRRSALQNILGAVGSGYQAAGGAFEQGLKDIALRQQIGQGNMKLEAIKQVLADPKVANDPAMKAWVLNNPDKALETYIKRRGMADFMANQGQPAQPAVPQAQPSLEPPSAETPQTPVAEDQLPGVQVTAPPPKPRPYEKDISQADLLAKYWSSPEGDDPAKAKQYQDIAKDLRGRQRQEEIVVNPAETLAKVHPTLQTRVATLNDRAQFMEPSQVIEEQNSILKDDAAIKKELDQQLFNQRLKEKAAQGGILFETPKERFSRESDLRKEYQGIPVIKDFHTVKVAYNQINGALSNPSAANDLAAATKFMKLLDPGSVVRESELGMAMAATGVLDRAQNYFNMLKTGQKLTPAQREDFKTSAGQLYKAAENIAIPIQSGYRSIAADYGINPNSVVIDIPGGPAVQPVQSTGQVPAGVTVRKVR